MGENGTGVLGDGGVGMSLGCRLMLILLYHVIKSLTLSVWAETNSLALAQFSSAPDSDMFLNLGFVIKLF